MAGMIHLLYNAFILFMLFLVFRLYNNYNYSRSKVKDQLFIGAICSVAIILCMSSPFHILPGYIFDLRTIPFLIGIFYGGYLGGGLSVLTLYFFRLYLGGGGVWNVLIVYSFILVLAFLMIPTYEEADFSRKKMICTGLAIITAVLMIVNTNFRVGGLPVEEWFSTLIYIGLHGSMAWITVQSMEGNGSKHRLSWYWGGRKGKTA